METDGKFIFTSGPDQRVNIWKIGSLNPEPVIQFYANYLVQVGDVGTLSILPHNSDQQQCYSILVAGLGLEIIQFRP